ncbi:MAG: hypothetical protein ABNH02_09265 [Pseudomonadales bacterium]
MTYTLRLLSNQLALAGFIFTASTYALGDSSQPELVSAAQENAAEATESTETAELSSDVAVEAEPESEDSDSSPWLLTPTLSSDPKMGSSLGFLAGYVHYFDKDSPSSIIGLTGSYSDTDSTVQGAFASTYFDKDRQRLQAAYVTMKIENDYQDYLGTGLDVNTTDDASIAFLRYLRRVSDDWFLGAQAMHADYTITGRDQFSQALLKLVGIDGFNGTAVGLVAERDSRDNVNNPQSGSYFQVINTQYLEALNDDLEFGIWQVKYSRFDALNDSHLIATQFSSRSTNDAPKAAYSSVRLRGYTAGEYLAPHNMSFEVEDRIKISSRWGATVFAGATCLFGDGEDCGDSSNWFPMVGAGVTYLLKPSEGMVVRLEGAKGQDDSYGVYLQFGNSF